MKTEKQMAAAAAEFAERWKGRGYERGESQPFWIDLLSNVFGIDTPSDGFITFEDHRMVDASNFIDARIPSTRVLIEQKSLGKDLRSGIRQSDGSLLNPFQQARRYVVSMPVSEHPRWIVTCNFAEFLIYDMEQPNGEPEQILLENLGREFYRLRFLVDTKSEHITREMEVSMQAGEIVGKIYDALLKQYDDNSAEALRWLNILCVRIVFCLYAEDAGVFNHDQFHDFLSIYEAKDLRRALRDLFEVLNTPLEQRSKYLQADLQAFPYTNGGLFEEDIEIPQFTEELKAILLQHASLDFDWSEISPTIFGAVFESTLNPETRRSGGMHYTSIENIHKVIDPLFLNDLRRELDDILEEKIERQRVRKLDNFQSKLASLTFLDPACGSGNFLTETYLSLRRLENEAIRERYHGQAFLGFDEVNPIKVSIQQFYGIEINDFAVTVATTALWISEAQMLAETEKIIRHDIDFLPLKSYTNIKEGNALRLSWNEWEVNDKTPVIFARQAYVYPPVQEEEPMVAGEPVVTYDKVDIYAEQATMFNKPKKPQTYHVDFDYIMGNPPFVGARLMSASQKDDMIHVFGAKWKNVGNMDYVSCWYKRAHQHLHLNRRCHVAFVSTNSICQGEQVAALWRNLFEDNIRIDFAHRTFRWDSEASLKAHVHCVVVGFSKDEHNEKACQLFDNDKATVVNHINAYLMDAPDVFIESRQHPLCDVPEMMFGNMANDGGNLLLDKDNYESLLSTWPHASKYIRRFVGADEFINNKSRYCLWLKGANPTELRQSQEVMRRIETVKEIRARSNRAGTRRMADYPSLFGEIRQPNSNYLLIPRVSSERRRYVPIGFMQNDVIASDAVQIIPDATLYHFGILESNVHMAWMRAVCGRLKSDYRYSKDIVYNNFPWPPIGDDASSVTTTKGAIGSNTCCSDAWKHRLLRIEQTAQGILDARALYPDSSLADLYDELTMPVELRRAHQQNDRAVMEAYGFPVKSSFTESQCVAELFKLYKEKMKQEET